MPDSPAIPAATLVLIRDRADAPPELLMVERAAGMAFAGGAMVFPGGRIDPGDHALAANAALHHGGSGVPDETAARIAAIRET
ncbi:MAG: NUDIX hydrolase, partial [Sphingomonadaceae bacterium]|nr:NUDIX hydrolase [Sphingomonadaceae bacterium]